MTNETTENMNIVVVHNFDAPVERIWQAWTDPEQVMRWWGPRQFTSPSCEIDFRVGGKFLFCMRAPQDFGGQDLYLAGVYTKIVPMERIEFTQNLSDSEGNKIDPTSIGMPADFPGEVRSTLAFKRLGDKTELTCTEYDWTPGQMADYSRQGLSECMDKLAETLP